MIFIHGINDCHYCTLTKNLLNELELEYRYIEIGGNLTNYLDEMADLTGNTRTLPLIFVGSNFIGGYHQFCMEYLIEN
jgi:glutaredoxin